MSDQIHFPKCLICGKKPEHTLDLWSTDPEFICTPCIADLYGADATEVTEMFRIMAYEEDASELSVDYLLYGYHLMANELARQRTTRDEGAATVDDALEIFADELARRTTDDCSKSKQRSRDKIGRRAPVEFAAQIHEFSEAAGFLLADRPRTKKAQFEFVDLNVANGEVELVTTGASSMFPAEVIHAGYGRTPYLAFEWFSKAVMTLSEPFMRVSIEPGRLKVANLTFSHPDISIRLIGARVADLPMDAPLADVLALLARYSTEELSESGLLARVLAAQEQAAALIQKAAAVLHPLAIETGAVSRFIWEQIRQRSQSNES